MSLKQLKDPLNRGALLSDFVKAKQSLLARILFSFSSLYTTFGTYFITTAMILLQSWLSVLLLLMLLLSDLESMGQAAEFPRLPAACPSCTSSDPSRCCPSKQQLDKAIEIAGRVGGTSSRSQRKPIAS
jgi:hypothetical protein